MATKPVYRFDKGEAPTLLGTDQVTVPDEDVNADTLRARAAAALAANANFLAIGAPTNAQVLAQVQTLTRECNGIIRLLLGALDSTAGT